MRLYYFGRLLAGCEHLAARVGSRPRVIEALKSEGLLK